MFDQIYDDARQRVCALAADLSPAQLYSVVPATPAWTARAVVGHLAGVAVDSVAGRLKGQPDPDWTAGQVAERAGRSLQEVTAEWAAVSPAVGVALVERRFGLPIVLDVLTHEADLREAFGLGEPPAPALQAAVGALTKQVARGVRGPGTLVIRAADGEWSGGQGEPTTTLRVSDYELFRGLMSRRSRAQMRAWDFSGGEPERYVETLPVFGPRDDDQPLPAAG